MQKQRIVVIGNGMVGHRFLEELVAKAGSDQYEITVFCEESKVAYDRVHLSSYFSHHTVEELSLVKPGFYEKNNIQLLLGEAASIINPEEKIVSSKTGRMVAYDKLVFATGSFSFVPPIKGYEGTDTFVYRTIDDLDAIEKCARNSKSGVVIGGGLLGLEAAGALKALGVETHVIERAPMLMAEQLDQQGGNMLTRKIESLGVKVHSGKNTLEITDGEQARKRLVFDNDETLEVDFIVFSTGIRPRDRLARLSGLEIGERGGIVINDQCLTSNPDVFAIGECALWNNQVFGLVAPGYKMAKITAERIVTGDSAEFTGSDMSAKLKLLGVDVGGIGDAHGRTKGAQSYVYQNEPEQVYKKLVVSEDGKRLLGAVLVGDTSDFDNLLQLKLNNIDLPESPEGLILPNTGGDSSVGVGVDALPDTATICSCFDISKQQIAEAVQAGHTDMAAIKAETGAGTGCGGCVQLVGQVLNAELLALGVEVKNNLCDHFEYSRQELFHIIQVEKIRTFDELLAKHGSGHGCEVCKPVVGSILSSCWNEYILEESHAKLHDTNDVFLGNMQKDGTYSVIPRMPGGEVTPEGLMAVAKVARDYSLYTKVTGAQRIGLFGAHKSDLPEIWRQLIEAGFETGQAYAKALRMAKTCVGSTWCRYGVADSVGLGVELEHRYKGFRTPHKMKFGVSGCTRECAEAQGKDIGIIATDKGWNLYVSGNGGMRPRHGDLLASDLDKEALVRTIDRFLMFYIRTADKLQRTSVWMESLEGGVDYVREVVMNDSLGLCKSMDKEMQSLVDSYQCEWKTTLDREAQLKRFNHFINSDQQDENVQFVAARDQHRPATSVERIAMTPVEA
ncbi:nitrite reductase (NAD(P)H) [Endozoicomonas sp. OPT23]|uniref:nitrite reductase large subunit NirB n=1 Tax=Endozoicomonas sp. OPT23 TaxID=2072845 RepID=UPI00129B268E|nr:nitrite reductase large subunit NirB [Endozoicomonas sp. OPT23]MRI34798.1 nitrite reductase (NAD(P)H) [Endozoicomonas sp. OPT23]